LPSCHGVLELMVENEWHNLGEYVNWSTIARRAITILEDWKSVDQMSRPAAECCHYAMEKAKIKDLKI
ncbi:hypothetical protein A2U01_0055609, partial [Trifolium medium]|nr:hypothetical protein [Trifolium medium]